MHQIEKGEWYANDIKKVEADEIPNCDIWTAGFPCQEISVSGRRLGLSGGRSGLFYEICRLLKGKSPEDKPRWVIIENVKNLLSINGGRDFTIVLSELSEAGYDAEWQLLNSKDFCVPQSRERVFIIGHLGGIRGRKVFPIEGSNPNVIKQLIGGKQGQRVYSTEGIGVTLTSGGGGQGAKTGLYFIDLSKKTSLTENARCIKARYNSGISNHSGESSGVYIGNMPRAIITPYRLNKRQNGRRMKEFNEPMFTITTVDRHGIEIGGRIRKLTPLECFRLQGFPDEMFYKAQGVNSDNQLYKQAGNSVTVPIIYEIGIKLKEISGGV